MSEDLRVENICSAFEPANQICVQEKADLTAVLAKGKFNPQAKSVDNLSGRLHFLDVDVASGTSNTSLLYQMLLDYVQFPYVLVPFNAVCLVIFHIYCSNRKSARTPRSTESTGDYNDRPELRSNAQQLRQPQQPPALNIRPPAENKMMGTYDPNYQTLAGLNNDVFAPKGGAGGGGGGGAPLNIRPPAQNKMMGTYDPNYQTLAGLNNDDVFKKKDGGGGGGGGGLNIRPPAQNKMMGTYDPNYQTLAGLNNDDVFKKKDGGGGGGGGGLNIRPPAQNKMIGTYDPNYQTLAGLNNDDVFKKKETAGGGGGGGGMKIRPPAQNKMIGTYDPNYQTLAGLNNDDVFKPKGCGMKNEIKEDRNAQWCTY
ncbi:hypothetical protein Y032_0027g1545 [Ancylostoma ceylanicum]|uniref:Uncharacterized protein n=2 Tax=Ancylostoma ceylanicum TaxID=53326 RepID=A0A016UVK9_9BILA|nr:hypothetical protein Y032_0027g1545 [Ancylostoma ceylanicum]